MRACQQAASVNELMCVRSALACVCVCVCVCVVYVQPDPLGGY